MIVTCLMSELSLSLVGMRILIVIMMEITMWRASDDVARFWN